MRDFMFVHCMCSMYAYIYMCIRVYISICMSYNCGPSFRCAPACMHARFPKLVPIRLLTFDNEDILLCFLSDDNLSSLGRQPFTASSEPYFTRAAIG